MKKKFLSLILAVFMILSIAIPAFAEETTFDNNNGAATDSFSESGDNETTIDTQYTVTKSAGTDDGTLDYYVKVEWTKTAGHATSKGDTYYWDASRTTYIRRTIESELSDNTAATVNITIENQSNAKVNYDIAYANKDGYTATETATIGSTTGSIDAYKDGTTIEGGAGEKTIGIDEYTYTNDAPSVNYQGSVKLDSSAVAIATNTAVGTYTVNITAAPVTKQTVSTTVDSSQDTTTLKSIVNPAEDNAKGTEVKFPNTIKALSDANGQTANLTVNATEITTASGSSFAVSDSSKSALGALELTLKVNGVEVSEFKDANGTDIPVTVTTKVAKNIDGFKLSHTKDNVTTTWDSTKDSASAVTALGDYYYNSSTGELVFATTHFSTYVIEGTSMTYNEAQDKAYPDLQSATNQASYGNTITLLKNITNTGSSYLGSEGFVSSSVNIDLNGHTVSNTSTETDYKGSALIFDKSFTGTISNGTVAGKTTGIYAADGYTLTINDCVATGAESNSPYSAAVRVSENSNVTINSGIYTGYHAVNLECSGATVTINGGTFNGDLYFENVNTVDAYLYINGGTFNGSNGNINGQNGSKAHVSIKGGTFNWDPSAYLPIEYKATESNGVWTVTKRTGTFHVKNNNQDYSTWAQAFSAAYEYDDPEIVLLEDASNANGLPEGSACTVDKLTLDLNSHTMTCYRYFCLSESLSVSRADAYLTIKNGMLAGNGSSGDLLWNEVGTITLSNVQCSLSNRYVAVNGNATMNIDEQCSGFGVKMLNSGNTVKIEGNSIVPTGYTGKTGPNNGIYTYTN